MDLYQQLVALSQIIIIDFVLAGDNAIVVGMAASRVHPSMRARVIFWGVAGAVVLRILFAAVATQLLTIVGLTLAGGILLLWVCWKMYREITLPAPAEPAFAGAAGGGVPPVVQTMTFGAALMQIIVADVSMSLDNVLAVAGAAKGEPLVLIVGLAIGIVLMAVAANLIATSWPATRGLRGLAFSSSFMLPSTWYSTARARSPALPGRVSGASPTS